MTQATHKPAGKEMLAVDHSSSGELAVSRLRIQGASELEEEYTGTYAVAKIAGSWPITSQLVHTYASSSSSSSLHLIQLLSWLALLAPTALPAPTATEPKLPHTTN